MIWLIIFAGIFMAMLKIVGQQLTNLTAYNEYITDVIIAVIVYLSAFSLVIRMMLSGRKKKKIAVADTAPIPRGAAVEDQARRGAGREEAEVVHVRRRRDRQEAADFRAPHQKLHTDPGAEAEAGDPGRLRLGVDRLDPVERRRVVDVFQPQMGIVVHRSLYSGGKARYRPRGSRK